MAINDTTIADGDGLFSDWIEVHNPTASAIDVGGYHLTDNPGNLDKWEFPSGTILSPGEYRVFFASGQDASAFFTGVRIPPHPLRPVAGL